VKHPYISSEIRQQRNEDVLRLSYSQFGFYARDEGNGNNINESNIMGLRDPYNYYNDKNAILLNCKDAASFNEIYEKAIDKHFRKQYLEDNKQ
jgi:hypothetical protein